MKRHRSGRVLRETTLAEIQPPPGFLSYDDGGRYCLVAVWGYPVKGELSRKRPMVVFSIIDTATGDEVERTGVVVTHRAERRAHSLRERVRELNEDDS